MVHRLGPDITTVDIAADQEGKCREEHPPTTQDRRPVHVAAHVAARGVDGWIVVVVAALVHVMMGVAEHNGNIRMQAAAMSRGFIVALVMLAVAAVVALVPVRWFPRNTVPPGPAPDAAASVPAQSPED